MGEQPKRLGLPDVRPLVDSFIELLDGEMPECLLAVALYGSFARGEARTDSDVDLLIVVREGKRREGGEGVALASLKLEQSPVPVHLRRRGLRAGISPLTMDTERLERHPWILLDIVDHGVILLDKEGTLGRELESVRRRMRELGSRKVALPDGAWYWDLKPDWKPGEIFDL